MDHALKYDTYSLEDSQRVVYGHPTLFPLFIKEDLRTVNIKALLYIANFFKFHMTREIDGCLLEVMKALDEEDKPGPWQSQPTQGLKPLGTRWLGSYAYLETKDCRAIRRLKPGICVVDSIDTEDGLQNLELDFDPTRNTKWPLAFEDLLGSMPTSELLEALYFQPRRSPRKALEDTVPAFRRHPSTSSTSALPSPPAWPIASTAPAPSLPTLGKDFLVFSGSGVDRDPFICKGVVHPLPPQNGIPGWQRITLLKYFKPVSTPGFTPVNEDPFGQAPEDEHFDWANEDNLDHVEIDLMNTWAYEGVVLPGGHMMLGRWWSPLNDEEMLCTGPWIFWNVPG